MKIHFLGAPDASFARFSAHEFIPYGPEVPPFAVDALLVFTKAEPEDDHVKTLRRSGRPVLHLASNEPSSAPASAPQKDAKLNDWLERLGEMPRTNYLPIDCNFYDNFEAAIVQRREVELEYRNAEGATLAEKTRLKDLKTDRTEEYVQLENSQWLRLDRIVSVDGEAAGASCRF